MKLLIVEDEESALTLLCQVINEEFCDCEIVGCARDVQQAIKISYKTRPDIIIADITLGNRLSFELFEYLEPQDYGIIFVCAYKEFAFQAIQYGAVAYILKPLDRHELVNAINRAIHYIPAKTNEVKAPVKESGIVYFYQNHLRQPIAIKNLVKIRADGSYSLASLENGKVIHLSRHLKYYENMLLKHGFIRTHKSMLTNTSHILEYCNGNNPMIRLTDGSKERLSRKMRHEIINLIAINV